MFDRLFGRKRSLEGSALPIVRNVTLGRSIVLDPLAWRRFGDALRFPFDRDTLQIVAQGQVTLNDGGFVHRFYTDDDVMFQAVSNDAAGQDVTDVTLFAPWDSQYPTMPFDRPAWLQRLTARTFTAEGLPEYRRFWFGDEAVKQEPVTFWEDLHDDRDGIVDRRIFQTSMLFARDLDGDGRELLLAIDQENEAGEVSFEIMLGVALELGEFRA
ncbi:DUF2491 family protein [Sphingomonas solaris]|uniref:DUF2491 family protein n=1 Tax=Alterirhizorhabdus solaris TaxID=2529389 RepID=A0A558R8P0_9SPHN|nr:DUF2491 family protein [Sphingomonas solaris]TVV75736.1 DUF2491 family protein [Sphingomonas solaris]